MAHEAEYWFENAIEVLTYNRNQRVWSIIISLFGDLARRPGDQISGALLSRITEPMHIKPEAVRVALHRLRNDHWITSEKQGRSSLYGLTPDGLEQSQAASPRIYAPEVTYPNQWHLCISAPQRKPEREAQDKQMRRAGYLVVAPGVYLGSGAAGREAECLSVTGSLGNVPDWLMTSIAQPNVQKDYADLEAALDRFAEILSRAPAPSALQIATLRTIIVHIWRRALFSHPDLPPTFFPQDWRGFACGKKVMAALNALPRPDLAMLEETV